MECYGRKTQPFLQNIAVSAIISATLLDLRLHHGDLLISPTLTCAKVTGVLTVPSTYCLWKL